MGAAGISTEEGSKSGGFFLLCAHEGKTAKYDYFYSFRCSVGSETLKQMWSTRSNVLVRFKFRARPDFFRFQMCGKTQRYDRFTDLQQSVKMGVSWGGLFSLIEKLEHGDSGGAAENPNCGGGNFADRKAKKIRQEERQTIGDMARIWKMVSNETNIQLFALDLFRGNQIRCIASPL